MTWARILKREFCLFKMSYPLKRKWERFQENFIAKCSLKRNSWASKILSSKFEPKSPIYRPLMVIHKSNQISIGNWLQCLCNQLHNYNLKGYDFWIWISKVLLLVIDYRHMVIDYMLKIQIQNHFQQLFLNPVFW